MPPKLTEAQTRALLKLGNAQGGKLTSAQWGEASTTVNRLRRFGYVESHIEQLDVPIASSIARNQQQTVNVITPSGYAALKAVSAF